MIKHLKLNSCESTQDELKRHLEVYNLVSTHTQTQGVGRRENKWDCISGSLSFSFSCAPHPNLTWQSLEVAVCLQKFIEKKFEKKMMLKWPNDLINQNLKCGGILLQQFDHKMLIGIGLNLLPNENWGSLQLKSIQLQESWYHQLPEDFTHYYLANSPMPIREIKQSWTENCAHMNKNVKLIEGQDIFEGLFQGLGSHGEAIIGNKSFYNGSLRF